MTVPTDTEATEAQRREIADGLAHLLADTATLYFKAHAYHWNVVGPQFPLLHSLFEDNYTELHASVDEIAERIRALGQLAPSSYRQLGTLASVPEADGAPDAATMVVDLAEGHEKVSHTARDVLATAEAAGDHPTADLVTRRINAHEKAAWMLRSTAA